MTGFFSKDSIIAPARFNRWRVPPASIAIHLCIGSVYAWSVFNAPLERVLGVAVSAPDDWSFAQTNGIYMTAIVFLGLSAAVAGKWMERVGPRAVGTVAALCWACGFWLGGLGIHAHQLWLVYLGYGVVGGVGLGLGYVSPVSTLIRWFPDRRGMATGMAIMGFGGGAMLGAPLKGSLMAEFYRPPQYLGTVADVRPFTENARRFAEVDGRRVEVVEVGSNELSDQIREAGVYVVGTGSTGVAGAFFALGAIYLVVMLPAALSYRLPAPDWKPDGWDPSTVSSSAVKMISAHHVGIDDALRTPQFYLLWLMLCLNVAAGIGMIGAAKTIVKDIFRGPLPQIVTDGFAQTYVLMISVANMLGRFVWASLSDRLGRKTIYTVFFLLGGVLYLSVPVCAIAVSRQPAVGWLAAFYAITMLIVSMYGGGFATIPAYLADLFGTKFVGGIHGRLLTAWSTAGVIGTLTLSSLREHSRGRAMTQLAESIDPAAFAVKFGVAINELPALIQKNVVTIPKLLELAPPGTIDPSGSLYNSTMVLMALFLGIAAVANWFVRPVDVRHHLNH
ncbi:MAG: MFS transporter [Planctomycetaceae bacterium]|nr:MFS transporter [Planctomycetaceae bacterium]